MGFGDVSGNQYEKGFGAVIYGQQKKKPREQTYPTLAASSANVNMERRLEAAGQEVPPQQPTVGQRVLGAVGTVLRPLAWTLEKMNRPGAAIRGAMLTAAKGGGFGEVAEAVGKAITGKEAVSGRDLLDAFEEWQWKAAESFSPEGKERLRQMRERGTIPSEEKLREQAQTTGSKAARFGVGLGLDIATDPMTYLALKAVKAKSSPLAKNIQKEIAEETGQKITLESAERFARNAAKGQIPVGRLETAIRRAAGQLAETKQITTGFGAIARTSEKIRQGQKVADLVESGKEAVENIGKARTDIRTLKEVAETRLRGTELDDVVRNIKAGLAGQKGVAAAAFERAKGIKEAATWKDIPDTAGLITEWATKPETRNVLHFAGQPVLDVTPVRTAAGAVIQRLPGYTQVKDTLGRVFRFNYTPQNIQGVERAQVTAAKERITSAIREVPYARTKAMREVGGMWVKSGLSKEAAEMAPHVIEDTVSGTAEAISAAKNASKMFADDAARFAQKGIPLNTIDNYVQHLYKDSPQKVQVALQRWRASKQVMGAKPGFTKSRLIPTLDEAMKLGLHPIEDVRQLTMVHRALTEQAVVLQDMGKDLLKMGGRVISKTDPGGWLNGTATQIPALKDVYVHPEVAKTLQNLMPVIQNTDEGMSVLSRLYNSAMGAWKSIVLFRPSFHARNAAGNVFLNMGDGLTNPQRYTQSAAALLGKLDDIELAGRRVPARVVLDQFLKRGLGGQGMFAEAAKGTMGVTDEAARTLEMLQRSGFQKVAYWVQHPFEASRAFGESTDTVGRLANFLHNLDRNGLNYEESADRVRRVLFDYGELTQAEKTLKKYAFPFYTWTRKVIPAMAERLISTPGLFTGHMHLRENMVRFHEIDETNLPQWLRDNQALPAWVDGEGNIHYLTINLPLSELSRIHENPAQELLRMANPLVKNLAELGTGRELISGRAISERTGFGRAIDYAKYAGKQFGAVRELASGYEAREEEERIAREAEKGNLPEVTKPKVGGFEKILGLTSVQNPAQWARSAQYARREQLTQAVNTAEAGGVRVPETDELPQPAQRKGFGAVASRGRGFGAVSGRQMISAAGEPPTVVRRAMDMAGVSPDWGPYLKILMESESDGNPMAVNQTWVEYSTGRTSNKREGTGWYRATGLYQVMPPTFERYKVEGHNDIFNPLDNALAAIRYIQAKYGHPARISRLGQSGYRGY